MVLLDKLLPKLKERDSRVLIFSQVRSFFYRNGILVADGCECFTFCNLFFLALTYSPPFKFLTVPNFLLFSSDDKAARHT